MVTQVNIREAKTHLSRLLARVQDQGVVIHPNFDDPLPEFDPDYMHPEDPMRELLR